MIYRVYHNKSAFRLESGLQLMHREELKKVLSSTPMKNFILVAEIKLVGELKECLDKAFEMTQHLESPWMDNPGIAVKKESRSTSVSDMIQCGDRYYGVMVGGFSRLSRAIKIRRRGKYS